MTPIEHLKPTHFVRSSQKLPTGYSKPQPYDEWVRDQAFDDGRLAAHELRAIHRRNAAPSLPSNPFASRVATAWLLVVAFVRFHWTQQFLCTHSHSVSKVGGGFACPACRYGCDAEPRIAQRKSWNAAIKVSLYTLIFAIGSVLSCALLGYSLKLCGIALIGLSLIILLVSSAVDNDSPRCVMDVIRKHTHAQR